MIKVTIIIPIYGVEAYIERCAYSLFNQTYDNIEYIFVNDATKDKSIEILSNIITLYPERKLQCRIIHHKQNKGLAGARITGIEHSQGDYVMHVDSDDYLEVHAVERLVQKAKETMADIIVGGFYAVSQENKRARRIPEHLDRTQYIQRILNMSIYTNVWGKLYSAKLYLPGLDTYPVLGINHGEDYVTLPRLLYYAKDVAYVDEPLYNYMIGNASSYMNNFTQKSMTSLLNANEKLQDFFSDKLDEDILGISLVRSKLHMFKYCNISLYDEIQKLYPLQCQKYYSSISIADKILLSIVDMKLYKLAVLYIKLGLKIVRYVR